MPRKALLTGVTGQDGAYLAEFLLDKGYEVHGIRRRASLMKEDRVEHLCKKLNGRTNCLTLHHGDLSDASSLTRVIADVQPDEIYNLGAQSHVAISFEEPQYTAEVDAIGVLRMLEAIRSLGLTKSVRFYQAATSELYGMVQAVPQNEKTPFYPRSPYSIAKQYAYWITVNYRESYGMYACNGILFNHESPLRGEAFVTRKITQGFSKVALGIEDCLELGNLDAKRDWGHAKDYVRAQWLMLQQDEPEDFVIASGQQHSVREFVNLVAKELEIDLEWSGKAENETARVRSAKNADLIGKTVIKIDPKLYRPAEVDTLLGDPTKAKQKLGWEPEISFEEMVREMVECDYAAAKRKLL